MLTVFQTYLYLAFTFILIFELLPGSQDKHPGGDTIQQYVQPPKYQKF
jgi:hypothetical protein